MYLALLHTHNLTRWLVLVAAVAAVALAIVGLVRRGSFTRAQRIANTAFVASMDLQLVLGIALYSVSPLVRAALQDMGSAMADSRLRFVAVEHATVMIVAVAIAHVGSVMVRRATNDRARHVRTLVYFAASLAAVLFAIPWDQGLLPGA